MSKIVVITGASGGIGAATAELLATRGMSLGLVARREDALNEIARRCGSNVLAIPGDASKRADVRRVVVQAIDRFGRIDVWINNVGQGITRVPSQLTDQDIDDIMRINVKSALYGMQEVLPHFKERGEGHTDEEDARDRQPARTATDARRPHWAPALVPRVRAIRAPAASDCDRDRGVR